MRIPHLTWNRRHNVASIAVSFGARVWQTREVADLILGFNATGRLSRVVLLDPRALLPPEATAADALEAVTAELLRHGAIRQAELDVLRSALERARTAAERLPGNGGGPEPRTLPLGPRSRTAPR